VLWAPANPVSVEDSGTFIAAIKARSQSIG
jgi:hypothetical protein